jgi:hypothetical protein
MGYQLQPALLGFRRVWDATLSRRPNPRPGQATTPRRATHARSDSDVARGSQCCSAMHMETDSINADRSSVSVVARVADVLVIE